MGRGAKVLEGSVRKRMTAVVMTTLMVFGSMAALAPAVAATCIGVHVQATPDLPSAVFCHGGHRGVTTTAEVSMTIARPNGDDDPCEVTWTAQVDGEAPEQTDMSYDFILGRVDTNELTEGIDHDGPVFEEESSDGTITVADGTIVKVRADIENTELPADDAGDYVQETC